MTDLIVLHPAPVRFTPARGRADRSGLAATRTPVRLRRAARDGFERVRMPSKDVTGAPDDVIRDADGLWTPMKRLVGVNLVASVTPDQLVAYLGEDGGVTGLGSAFRGTPLASPVAPVGRYETSRPHYMYPSTRGDAIDLDGARSIQMDGRGRAGRGMAAFLDGDVRILTGGKGGKGGEQVYRRFAPVLAMVVRPGMTAGRHLWRVPYALNVGSINGMLCQPDDAPGLVALAGGLGMPTQGDGGAAALARAVGTGDWSADVMARVANIHAPEVWKAFAMAYAHLPDGHGGIERLRPLAARLSAMAAFAPIGLAQGDDPAEALRDLSDAIRESGATAVPRTGPYVLEAALNRLLATAPRPEPAAEDVEALEGLVLGR